jgi:signal transduction histidine kinase
MVMVTKPKQESAVSRLLAAETKTPAEPHLTSSWLWIAALPALALAALSLLPGDPPTSHEVVRAVLVALWAVAGGLMCRRRRQTANGPIVLVGATIGGIGALCASLGAHRSLDGLEGVVVDLGVRLSAALLPAVALHALLALPDGHLATARRRQGAIAMYVVGALVGLGLMLDRDHVALWPIVLLWVVALSAGLFCAHASYEAAGATDRRRMQWVGLALAVGTEAVLVVLAISALTSQPSDPWAWAFAATGVIPIALAASTFSKAVSRVDRLLTYTVSLAGLTALVVIVYAAVVLALGRTPRGSERTLLLLSMAAAAIAALIWMPARHWLGDAVNRVVYGERVSPDEALRTWGSRLTRAIPMDELLLQLCESLRKSMSLTSAEVWTGSDGHYEWATGVPHRTPEPLFVGEKERPVVARAGVSGGTWLEIWLPGVVVAGRRSSACRVAPLAHQGELLGLIVCRRPDDAEAFTEEDDRVLAELARQVGLALHNMQLDTALQASLAELRDANDELRASRARIVAAGDAERRKLERNLHDGAQQHLVALAVKLRLAKDAVDDDPAGAIEMIDELRGDVQETIQELRSLAHGIFPPLLVSGGLMEALPAATNRAALAATFAGDGVGRYPAEVEAAVYFCCVEAMQNAGKHAGDDAKLTVRVWEADDHLQFEVADDGAGFDAAGAARDGHGFVNMADRLGAIDGTLVVDSAPGRGTRIAGRIPVPA